MNYWLIKSEGDCYSIDDLKKDMKSPWSGVRNFQARNFMRDRIKVGDLALFYHSSSTNKDLPNGVYGIAEVASSPYTDESAFDKKDEHYDPSSDKRRVESLKNKIPFEPTWVLVDFAFKKKFDTPFTLSEIKIDPKLDGMLVRQKGSRLSIQPVSEKHFNYIVTKRQ
ncbi:MAG: EVE domain-containing protein [Candidatus Pacebacteria bacterium]|nr:EVE domain-containing protein [Candidatus Paceibacterota bacterium]